jgi:signal transduction histidine kinase
MLFEENILSVKLLIVDDRRENLFALSSLLEDMNVDIFTCESGVDALNLMLDHEFALALIDVQMPEMNGFELAELIRGAERTKHVPIIFVTAANENSGFAFKGYESGAVDFLYKPIDSMVMRSKVQVFIELDQQKRLLRDQVDQLKVAKAAAEKANELKSAFLANMSHEIRTPLAAIIGFTDLIKVEHPQPEVQSEYLDIIERNGKVLVKLIDDILDLSKVESGHLELEYVRFSPEKLLQAVFELMNQLAQKKGLYLKMQLDGKIPTEIVSDPTRLRQVLTNIIGNAIKFTEQGGVTVSITSLPKNMTEPARVSFKVTDTGIGMTEEQSSRLFQTFMQADNTMTRRFGGTGLGLILSKRLSRLMGGDVILQACKPNEGSCFEISVAEKPDDFVKANVTAASLEAPVSVSLPKNHPLKGKTILVVEDSEDNQLLIKNVLSEAGASVEMANNGQEGVKAAQAKGFDVVIMDIQMPIMDGLQATTKLRDEKYERPILALTANAMSSDREKYAAAGFDEYLMKPINFGDLLEKVIQYANHGRTKGTPSK